jgi:hypothetical protein
VFILWLCACNDVATIRYQEVLIFRGVYGFYAIVWNLFICTVRLFTSHFVYFVLVVYVLSTAYDSDDEETYIDQVMNFTALLILIQIDEIILGAFFNRLGQVTAFDEFEDDEDNKKNDIIYVGSNIIRSHKNCSTTFVVKVLQMLLTQGFRVAIDGVMLSVLIPYF